MSPLHGNFFVNDKINKKDILRCAKLSYGFNNTIILLYSIFYFLTLTMGKLVESDIIR
jgi:hypothetical protein